MKGKEALFGMFCGVVGAVLTMVVGSFAPLGAQNDVSDAEFRTITYRRMNVVDSEGAIAVEIVADEIDGGMVVVRDKDSIFPLAVMSAGEYGGEVTVGGKDTSRAEMSVNKYGSGVVSTSDENGYRLATLK